MAKEAKIKKVKAMKDGLKSLFGESTGKVFYQPVVFYHYYTKVGFHTEATTYPYYANKIFDTPNEAVVYLGLFIRKLVEDGSLPEKAIKGNEVNDDIIKTAIISVDYCRINIAADDADKIDSEMK